MRGNELGRSAIVVGAGMAGLVAARVLSEHFAKVYVLERDVLPDGSIARPGVPQGAHYHALLTGGINALERLFDGFAKDVEAAGAVELIGGLDLRLERPGLDPMPQRDLRMRTFSLSRPLLELCVRRRVSALPQVAIEEGVQVRELRTEQGAVTGVELVDGGTRSADLVVDASGRGELSFAALVRLGFALPRVERVRVDVRYSTAIFRVPDDATSEWKGVMTFPDPALSTRGALLAEVEGDRWFAFLGGRGDDAPPGDAAGFMEYARNLRTGTIYRAIEHAQMLGPPERFGFPESQFRHYEELTAFPAGLLPVGDAICRFNPVYGQGMSVAAIELLALQQLLADAPELGTLAARFFQQAAATIAGPWSMSVIPDFAYPTTHGEAPPNLAATLRYGAVLSQLAARDQEVHRLLQGVANLVTPHSALSDPALVMRVVTFEQELRRDHPERWGKPTSQ